MKLPKNTCPDIDRCIKWVKALAEEAKECGGNEVYNLQVWIIDTLEELRTANSQLRDAAIGMEDELNETEERLEAEILALKDEIYELVYTIQHGDAR